VAAYSSAMLEQTYYSACCKKPEDHHQSNACCETENLFSYCDSTVQQNLVLWFSIQMM